MSSNVGLPTPRGSGTSGYVQRNWAFLKPRSAGYGAPYPPVGPGSKKGSSDADNKAATNREPRPFDQRQPDKKILEHERRREVEVKVFEERERLEERNEEVEGRRKGKGDGEKEEEEEAISEEEIERRCDELRGRLLRELEGGSSSGGGGGGKGGRGRGPSPRREKKQLKSHQVHELAEAKIEESERLRRALGIPEDWEKRE